MAINRLLFHLVDIGRRTDSLRILPSLLESQWYDQKRLLAMQNTRLQKLIRHVYEHVPFYRRVFERRKLVAADIQTVDDLAKLPIIDKKTINRNYELFISDNISHLSPRTYHTSGSTGEPFTFHISRDYHSFSVAARIRNWMAARYALGKRFIVCGGAALASSANDSLQRNAYYLLQGAVFLSFQSVSTLMLKRYARFLGVFKPQFLYGYPSALYLLAKHVEPIKARTAVEAVITTSEILTEQHRNAIRRAFDCAVYNEYGCNDGGIISMECPYHNGFHYAMEGAILETVDKNGSRLAEHSVGRVVSTNLLNYAMPLIRYDTGDVGELTDQQCACGRGLAVIRKLIGRSREYIVTPAGRFLHGALFNQIMYQFPWVERFQIIQRKRETIEVRLAVSAPVGENDMKEMYNALKVHCGQSMQIDLRTVEQFAATQAGKFKVVVSEVK